jgi:hypothetical protein
VTADLEDTVFDYDPDGPEGSATAVFNAERTHRYALLRCWDADAPMVTFVMLNPSTADAFTLDPTVRRCLSFARREGAGSLQVVNLFALRSTDPAALYSHPDPVGPLNNQFIRTAAWASTLIVAGWGAHGTYQGRGEAVTRALTDPALTGRLHCLRVTKSGQPGHPLYIPGDAPLLPYGAPHLAVAR